MENIENFKTKLATSAKEIYATKESIDFNEVTNSDFQISRNKKFYVGKDVDFSRHNLRILCEKFDCSITRDVSKADYIIVDSNRVYSSYYYVSEDGSISSRWFRNYKKTDAFYVYPEDTGKILESSAVKISKNTINSILFKNVELPVIDEEQYKILNSMFEGTHEDITLATSLITNCDLKKSMFFVYQLIADNKWAIRNLKLHQSVKFKTLMSFFEENDILNFDQDKMFEILIRREALTVYNLNALMQRIKERTVNYIKNTFNTENIIVKLSVTDEIKNEVLRNEVNPNQLSLFDGTTK